MDIGIIGSGQIGSILARRLAALGHQIRIANSRGPESLAALAAETGATASTVEQAASARDVVIVTIPQKAVPELPRGLFAGSTAVVVDTGNYYPARDGRIDAIESGLTDSEWVAQVLGRPVVKAFNNIVAASLDSRGTPEGASGRVCLSVAGDEPAARQVVLRLVGELGFDGSDAGSSPSHGASSPAVRRTAWTWIGPHCRRPCPSRTQRGSHAAVRPRTNRHVRSSRRASPAHAELRHADVALRRVFGVTGSGISTIESISPRSIWGASSPAEPL
jgi:8-hydroxy-5-deazaflavin:NADPH oxidoreductase